MHVNGKKIPIRQTAQPTRCQGCGRQLPPLPAGFELPAGVTPLCKGCPHGQIKQILEPILGTQRTPPPEPAKRKVDWLTVAVGTVLGAALGGLIGLLVQLVFVGF